MNHERARTLLNKAGLTSKDHQAVRDLLGEFTKYKKIKHYEELAGVGVSLTALTQWMSSTYKGDNERVAFAVLRLIDKEFRGLDIDVPFEFIKTRICTTIVRLLKDSAARRQGTVIFGPAGIGKTVACKVAAHRTIPGAIHIECTEGSSTPGSFIKLLARRTGCPKTSGTIGDLEDALIQHLRSTAPYLIIDDGQYLKPKCLNILRDIIKLAEIGVGFIGTIDLDQSIDDATEHHGQLARLIVFRYDISDELHNHGSGYFSVDEIAMFCKAHGFEITPKGIERVKQYADVPGWGGLGQAGNVLRKAQLVARGENIRPSDIDLTVQQTHGRNYANRARMQMQGIEASRSERGRKAMKRAG